MEPSDSNGGVISNPAGSNSRPESAQSFESSQHFCLRWNNYQTNLTNVFDQLLQNESFVDVTLTTDETGQSVKCHKVVLSACSPYFQKLFMDNPCQHPIVILRDVDYEDLKFVVDYMYKGEINVTQNQLTSILRTAEMLKVRGLDEMVKTKDHSEPELEIERSLEQPKDLRPHKKRKFSLESIEGFPKRIGIKTRDDLFDHEQQKIRQNMAANSNNLPHPDDMESPRATPDHFRQPTGGATGYEVASRSQSGHSDGGFESKPATIGKPPNKHSPALLDDMTDVKPGIMEMIQEERRAKLLEASQITQNWMQAAAAAAAAAAVNSPQAATSGPARTPPTMGGGNPIGSPVGGQGAGACNASNPNMSSKGYCKQSPHNNNNNNTILMKKSKVPSWSQAQLKEAITCILTQQLRFTQASTKFKIPKGTLYDNILGKTKRSRMLEEVGLNPTQEMAVLEFACDVVMMPYNRRTSRPLISIVNYVKTMLLKERPNFMFPLRKAFKWWWAFCKKHSIISLYYKEPSQNDNVEVFKAEEEQSEKQDELQRHLAAWKRRSKHYQYPSVATSEYIRGLFL